MTPERWQQVKDVLQQALELKPEDRAVFLDQRCAADHSLRQEVETLLSSSDEARSSFLESASLHAALTPGTKLGEYEVQKLLGSGGMGEVYRARDLRLRRDVAIKVLPSFLSSDKERLRRFEQEARAAAALNHPNILAVFQMGTYEGAPYLVSELLEGETLRDEIKRGPLTARKAVEQGVQIARGLAAAHEKGIVHRDLKPENLFATKDGRIKILDFGLAKLKAPQQQKIEHSAPTVDAQGTEPGAVMGTVGYMAPEQVRGQEADHRADIFAFGAVLYELLSGKRAFQKPTSAETMTAILNEEPPGVSQLAPATPPALQRVVHRCLEKAPEQRFQSASDLAFALEALSEAGRAASAVAGPGAPSRRGLGLKLAACAAVLLAAGLYFLAPNWLRRVEKKPLVQRELTANGSDNPILNAAISPDGRQLAYADRVNGLSLVQIDSGEKRTFPNTKGMVPEGWFPDGAHLVVGYFGRGGLLKMSTLDGTNRKILDESVNTCSRAVSPDGEHIAYSLRPDCTQIWVMGGNGEAPKQVLSVEPWHAYSISWSPSSRRLVFAMVKSLVTKEQETKLESCDREGGDCVEILSDNRLAGPNGITGVSWSTDRRVFYTLHEPFPNMWDRNIWSIEVNPDTGQTQGKPTRVTTGTGFEESSLSQSADGKRLVFSRDRSQDSIQIAPIQESGRALGAPQSLGVEGWQAGYPEWTLDSRAVLYMSNPQGRYGLFKQDVQTHETQAVVTGPDVYRSPVVSPEGKWLFFNQSNASQELGPRQLTLMRMPFEGGPASLVVAAGDSFACATQADVCVLSGMTGNQRTFSLLDPVKGRGADLAHTEPAQRAGWSLSADGKNIAILPDSDHSQIQIISLANGSMHSIKLDKGWHLQRICWLSDNQHFFVSGALGQSVVLAWVGLDGSTGKLLEIAIGVGWIFDFRASPDGRFLAYTLRRYESNATMLENF